MYYVYVLLSKKDKDFYVGFTDNVNRRLKDHNSGKVPSTQARRPFKLIYYEAHLSKKDALRPLGQILIEKKMIQPQALEEILDIHWRRDLALGEILKDAGRLDQAQLDKILSLQRKSC